LGKKPAAASATGNRPSVDLNLPATDGVAPAGRPNPPATPPGAAATGGSIGVLAGQVVDPYNRHPGAVYIQVSALQESNEPRAAPIEVAADSQGYFLIQGLQAGQRYQLIARTREGGQLQAGTAWAIPPNPRVVIRVSEDMAGANIPPLPAAPTPPVPPTPTPRSTAPSSTNRTAPPAGNGQATPPNWPPVPGLTRPRPDQAWAPGRIGPNGLSPERPAGLGAPVGGNDPVNSPPSPPRSPVDTTRISEGTPSVTRAPVMDVPNPNGPHWVPDNTGAVTPPIPYCSLNGRQLDNFALYDINGQPWEWRARNNRLTLIDFWGTWCVPCQQAIPHLTILQDRYRAYGLEVVGIAYEQGPAQYHVENVNRVAQRLHVNYTLLMGGDRLSCPVRTQFRVASWPTLFLVDEYGRILWQESGLDKHKLTELEKLIKQRLNVR
jgi:thiol-disulfide isomerase/thioredoxin